MSSADEVYPKSPLIEVVFEIRFPGNLVVECHRDELSEFLRPSMPVLRVPEIAAGESFKFRTYHFVSEDNAFTVMAGMNLLAFSSKKYEGFGGFQERLSPIFDFFCKRFSVTKLRRVGLRYINAIPFAREGGSIPVGRFLKSQFLLAPGLGEKFDLCSVGFVQNLGTGHITTRIEGIREQNSSEEALLLDFDYFKTENLHAGEWNAYLEESHGQTKNFFEKIITDQYRDFLRGKPLL
ncbi:MAG: TIGR04255 family protein [Elusimicrobiota bacterium]|jgi:uncharacterized protein (TIGR04255 family)